MPALHPDMEPLLLAMRLSGRPPFESLPPDAARQVYAAGRVFLQPPPAEVAEVRDLAAGTVPLRLYRGAGTAPEEVLPCLLFLHGGGWVVGDLASHDGVCRHLANAARCCVVSVHYRLAPEHPFPAAVEDAAAALAWVVAEAAALRLNPETVAVGGDSAGGNLAAVLALMGRDGTLPRSAFQMLLYPATDLMMTAESLERITEGLPLTARSVRWFVDHYVPDPAQRADWRASPLRAASLAGTPPALVLTVGHDPLCDEGRAYAHRLERDGVRVTHLHLADQAHGMVTWGKVIGATTGVLDFAAACLRDAWRTAAGQAP